LSKLPIGEVADLLNRFQRASKYPLVFGWSGICYHGGTDLRLYELMRIGATRSAELARLAGKAEAQEARAVGFHVVGAPVMDVNTNPNNPIINLRAFSDNADLVIELGSALCRGALEGGALPILMHFPGHGASGSDSHIAAPVIERTLEELESVDFRPFEAAFRQGIAPLVCTNHCHYPALEPGDKIPATLSRKIITGLLREKMRYEGVIMSDSLTMRAIKTPYGIEEGAIQTVLAGHDMILQDYETDPRITLEALYKAARDGRIPMAQIEASLRRVLKAKQSLGLFKNRFVDPGRLAEHLATAEHKALARRIACESVTVLEHRGLPPRGGAARVLLISNGTVATIEEDLNIKHTPANEHLLQRLRHRAPRTEALTLGSNIGPAEVRRAMAAAQEADVVVAGLFSRVRAYAEEGIRLQASYRELLRQVAGIGKTNVFINFGSPWTILDLPKPDILLCTYGDALDSVEASLEVLFGEIKPRGLLPVNVSKAYPFGYGLR
jgi:beta-N-acetylhexosaminidase